MIADLALVVDLLGLAIWLMLVVLGGLCLGLAVICLYMWADDKIYTRRFLRRWHEERSQNGR